MRKIIILVILIFICNFPVQAMQITPPTAPESVQDVLPGQTASFAEDLWYVIKNIITKIRPDLAETAKVCVSVIACLLLVSILRNFSGFSVRTVELVGVISVGLTLLRTTGSFVNLAVDIVREISEYGKVLLPVMTTALAAEGGITTATGLYTGTILFNTVLTTAVTKVMVPLVYIYIALGLASNAIGEELLKNMQDFVKWLMTWSLKIMAYLFTGYVGITGVVSGTVDANSVKAAKLALSGFVPVVGSVISDASEAVLVSAGVMKNAAGVYGLLVIIALYIGPFVRIGVQYLLLKLTGAVCGVFGCKTPVNMIACFVKVMGFLLAMTGCVCLIHLVSTVCFMKGVG